MKHLKMEKKSLNVKRYVLNIVTGGVSTLATDVVAPAIKKSVEKRQAKKQEKIEISQNKDEKTEIQKHYTFCLIRNVSLF